MDNTKSLKDFYNNVKTLLGLRSKANMSKGADFTVFTALRNEYDEVRTHTTFLYEMINRNGQHGMGDAFLKDFCSTVLKKTYFSQIKVSQEFHIDSNDYDTRGRPDLCIETPTECYPIEVKINAADQPEQIQRYFDFAKEKCKSENAEPLVYYLTLDGHKPTEKSLGNVDMSNVSCISFAEEIYAWLTNCAEIAKSRPDVVTVINQYIRLIEKLTNKRDIFMEEICSLIFSSKENYECASAISEMLIDARTEKMRQVLNDIKSHLEKYPLIEKLPKDYRYFDTNIDKYYRLKRKEDFSTPILLVELKSIGTMKINLYIQIRGALFYGVWVENTDWTAKQKRMLSDAFDNEEWKKRIKSESGTWQRNLPIHGVEELDFDGFSGSYSDLYDEDKYNETLAKIYDEIDGNLQSIIDTGLPERSSEIYSW